MKQAVNNIRSTYYLPNITTPKQAYKSYSNILSPIQEPSIILKCKLNSWRHEHESSMIIFDNRLLHNNDKLFTDLDVNAKQIDAFVMKLPTITYTHNKAQLRMFVYSKHYGLLAMDNNNNFGIYRLKFSDSDADTDEKSDEGWNWVKLETHTNIKMRPIRSITIIR